MSTATAPLDARVTPLDVLALQFENRNKLLIVPLAILGTVVVISILVAVALTRVGVNPGSTWNSGVVWSLPGYLISVGVRNVTASYPFALGLGSTRKAFVVGNLLSSLVAAIYVGLVGVALLGLEVATNGFFLGARVFRVNTLGDNDPVTAFVVLALGTMTALAIGGLFGASWTRFGPVGPTALAVGLALLIAIGAVVLLPTIVAQAASFQPWWLAVVAVVIIAVGSAGQYLLLRGASVR